MKSQPVLSVRTKPSASRSTSLTGLESIAVSASGPVAYGEFQLPLIQATPQASINIDDLAAEFEQTEAGARAMSRARQWVARNHFQGPATVGQLRLKRGWSQAELARRAGTSQSYIARLELGQVDPQLSTVTRLARALNAPLVDVVKAVLQGSAE